MKSIMEQASSIIKAIEKAWSSAGHPKEFSIKIFEKEEKNFFGMTTKPAKIGIFFAEKQDNVSEKHSQKSHQSTALPIQDKETVIKPKPPLTPKVKTAAKVEKPQQSAEQKPEDKRPIVPRATAAWDEAMINATTQWMETVLSLMGKNSSFDTEVSGKNLKIIFSHPLLENTVLEKSLFRSLAHLVMSSLRNQYKHNIKGLKVILVRSQH
jgi:predicted RNA-binding protein Jag